MNRSEALDAARKIICEDRNDTYGEPQDLFDEIGQRWIRDPVFVAIDMADMKMTRIRASVDHIDSYLDAIGYLAIAVELLHKDGAE